MSKTTAQYIEEAIKYYNRRQYPEALRIIEQAIQLNPASVRAIHARGVILTHMKEYDKAIESYEQACKLAPKYRKNPS